jgi:tetratricopeptide (TPR) repeat protein
MPTLNELIAAANKHLENGIVEDALAVCRQALSRAPHSGRVLKVHGACLMASGDMRAARASFAAALEIDPGDAGAAHDLGMALHALGEAEGARLSFERAITIEPRLGGSHEALAAVLAGNGDLDGAVRHMLVALELQPENPGTLANFASVMLRVGAFYDARSYFERALELDPGNAIIPLAHILHDLGEHNEAIALVEEAYLRRPRDPLTLSALGYGLAQVGQYEQGLEHVEMALKAKPDLVPALDAFALLTAWRGEPERGIARLAGLLKANKANQLLCLSLAAAMSRDGRYADSIALARQALNNPVTRGGAYTLIRQNLALLGLFDEMIELSKAFRQALPDGAASSDEAVIIPLETKPLEVVLLARFLGGRRSSDLSSGRDPVVFAPALISPLLERVRHGRRILPLGHADMARPGAFFIAQLAMDERILDDKPERFAPYVEADPRADDFWRGSLAPFKRPIAAITWSKYPPAPLLSDLDRALEGWPGTVMSLVWDDQRAELEGNKRIIDAGRHLTSLDALVDLIGKLDLVVAPDGLAIHIAGAMGVPGIVLVTPDKPWYWHDVDGRSYWYPSIRVLERKWAEPMQAFRQRVGEVARAMTTAQPAN